MLSFWHDVEKKCEKVYKNLVSGSSVTTLAVKKRMTMLPDKFQ